MFAEIRQILDGTWAHPACPTIIEGPPGSGKSAVLNASVAMARSLGVRVGIAHCDPADAATPFGVVRQCFDLLLGGATVATELTLDGTDLARSVLRNDFSSADDPLDVYESLLVLLETSGRGTVMLGVDNINWADPISLGFLRFVARRRRTAQVHLVLTMRTTQKGMVSAANGALNLSQVSRRFVMQPLSLESSRAMIDQHVGARSATSVVASAHRLTGGNPFLLAQLIATLDQADVAADDLAGSDVEQLHSSVVAQSVMIRTSGLPDGARELVEVAAVLGKVDRRVVAAVAGRKSDEVGRLADMLTDVGVFGWGRLIEFAHPFERQSVLADIQPTRRARLHADAAKVLAALGRDVAEVARHLLETDPGDDERATAFLIDAAQQQINAGELAQAARLLERAEREAPTNQLRAEVARLCAVLDDRSEGGGALEQLRRAQQLGLDAVALAETALDILDRGRDLSGSAALLEMAQSLRDQLERHHPSTARRLRLVERIRLVEPDRPHAAGPVEGDHLRSASPTGRLLAIEHALRAAAQMNCSHDQLLEALRWALPPAADHHTGLVHSAIVGAGLGALVKVGAYEIADPMIRTSIADSVAAGRLDEATGYTIILAESLAMQGNVIAADRALRAVTFEPHGALRHCLAMQRCWLAALRENVDEGPARPTDGDPLMAAPGLADLGASASMFAAERLARLQLIQGDWSNALITLDRLASAADKVAVRNPAFVPWRVARCTALAGLGRIDEGASLAAENLRLAEAFGSRITIAEALACVAKFQLPKTQVAVLQNAVGLLAGTSAELLRCNVLIDLGFARHHAGDALEARSTLREGADQANRLGVSVLAGVADRGLLACGARRRRSRTTGRDSLTPAELRVARLAATGETNASIAGLLFVNLKTVESHLTSAYKKLGITDRSELASIIESDDTDALAASSLSA